MTWQLETTAKFDKEFKKLDGYTQRMVKSWILKNLEGVADPRIHGQALTGHRRGLWRFRIGDYRLICLLEDERLVILALTVGHRKELYR